MKHTLNQEPVNYQKNRHSSFRRSHDPDQLHAALRGCDLGDHGRIQLAASRYCAQCIHMKTRRIAI